MEIFRKIRKVLMTPVAVIISIFLMILNNILTAAKLVFADEIICDPVNEPPVICDPVHEPQPFYTSPEKVSVIILILGLIIYPVYLIFALRSYSKTKFTFNKLVYLLSKKV